MEEYERIAQELIERYARGESPVLVVRTASMAVLRSERQSDMQRLLANIQSEVDRLRGSQEPSLLVTDESANGQLYYRATPQD